MKLVKALFVAACAAACTGSPTAPQSGRLATGRWSSAAAGQCMTVTESSCDLVVGCGHGVFPRPTLASDGTFEVDGSYRVEVGPISIDPPPPAHFSGSVTGSQLTLTVKPASLPVATYALMLSDTNTGKCSVPCL
jgi:hypothetical protein